MHSSLYRHLLWFWGILVLSSCNPSPGAEDLKYLQGYWEIQKVAFSDGGEKTYTANTTVDFFDWNGSSGYRKKVQPTLDGKYLTSDDALPMEILWRDSRLFLGFKGGDSQWEEEVLELDSLSLTTRHSNGLLYTYTRYEPFSLKTEDD